MASPPTDPRSAVAYKGKRTNRSWPQLPEEVISLIASYSLWNHPESPYIPPQHDFRRWFSRMAFACLRDVHELEKGMMAVCPEWRRAIEKHSLWPQVRRVLDANDYLTRNMVYYPPIITNASSNTIQAPIRFTEYQHIRNIIRSSCYICRINYPLSNLGLGTAKRHYHVVSLGYITICKDHDRNHALFCGFCLKDNSCLIKQPESSYEYRNPLSIYVNEDENLWPGVDATCRRCREDCLLRRVSQNHNDLVAIGGPTFDCPDWEARTCIESFLDLAEGTLADVLVTVREKAWLRRFTKYEDLGQQMLASQRSTADEEEEEEDVDEDDDSEADRDAMLTRQAPQVRDMSLTDWARRRILDGHWLSPADIWYRNSVPGKPLVVPALHPCPWAREGEVETDALGEELPHPLTATLASEVPPTYRLCEQAYLAHMQAVRELLGPAMRNVVRKIVLECAAAADPITRRYVDPAQLARKMTLEEVVRLLREEEGVWYEGVDWIERKRNEEEAKRFMAGAGKGDKDKEKEDDGDSTTSGSSASGGEKSSLSGSLSVSDATSPVLSTSTLQTTPSPPPLGDEASDKKEDEVPSESTEATAGTGLAPPAPRSTVRLDSPPPRPRFIPVDPVLSTPKLHGTIPYVPVTIAHLPNYSMQALSLAWRQACGPLYHCCCSICERAKLAEMNARAAMAALSAPQPPTSGYPQQQYQQQYPPPPPQQQIVVPTLRTVIYPPTTPGSDTTGEIKLKEAVPVGEGEDELEYGSEVEYDDDEEEEEEEDEDAEDDADGENSYDGYPYAISPEPDLVIEDDGVPPTKLVAVPPVPALLEPIPSHARVRKRSSDEVDVGDETTPRDKPFLVRIPATHPGTPPKRPRLMLATDEVSEVQSIATSTTATATATSRSPSPTAASLDLLSSPSRVAKRGSQELDVDRDDVSVTSSKRVKVQHAKDAVPRGGLPPSSPVHDSVVEEKSIPPLTSGPTPVA